MVTLIFYFKKKMVTLIWIGPARDRTCTAAALLGLRARSSGGTRGARAPGAAAPDGSTWPVAGDQALGGGCRLAGGEQLHVPFRGMLATQMCTRDPSVPK